jgi:hypothetical protein
LLKLRTIFSDHEILQNDANNLRALLNLLNESTANASSSSSSSSSSSHSSSLVNNGNDRLQNSSYGSITSTRIAVDLVCFLPFSPGECYSIPQIVTIPACTSFMGIVEILRETITKAKNSNVSTHFAALRRVSQLSAATALVAAVTVTIIPCVGCT